MKAPVRPFALARAVGMSSAAFGKTMSQLPGMGSYLNPQVAMWPVSSPIHPRPQKAINFEIGDGNDLEDTGLLAMLQRNASRIVSLINGPVGLNMNVDYCSNSGYQPTGHELTTQFANFFGYAIGESTSSHEFHKYNQVFASSEY